MTVGTYPPRADVPRAAPPRRLGAVEGSSRGPARLRPWIIFSAAVVLAFFGLIYSRISLDRSAFVLDELDEKIAAEQARHWDLRLEVANLQSPERIARLAEGMGMEFPDRLVALEVPGVADEGPGADYRWAQLRSLLSAQP